MHAALVIALCAVAGAFEVFVKDTSARRRYEVFCLGTVLFLFAALRAPSVGTDTAGYVREYLTDASWTLDQIVNASPAYTQSRDPVFHIFCHLLAKISPDPRFMLAVFGAWVAFCFSYFVYRQRGNVLLYYALFVGLRLYSFTLSGMRQALAMGFLLLAFCAMEDRRLVRFLVLTVLGGLFHLSALVFLPAYWICDLPYTKTVAGTALGVAFINFATGNRMVYFAASLLGGRFAGYAQQAIDSTFEGSTTFLIYVAFFAASFVFFPQMKDKSPAAGAFFRLTSVMLMFSAIGQSLPNMFRLAYYFAPALFALISLLMHTLFERKMRIAATAFLIVFLFAQYLVFGPAAGTDPYIFYSQV